MAYRYSLWYTMFIGIVHYWRIFLSSFCLDNSAYTAYDTLPVENSNLFIGCRASEQNTYCKSYKKAQYKYTRQSTSHGSLSLLPRSRRARFFFICFQTVPVPVPLRFEAGLNLIFEYSKSYPPESERVVGTRTQRSAIPQLMSTDYPWETLCIAYTHTHQHNNVPLKQHTIPVKL